MDFGKSARKDNCCVFSRASNKRLPTALFNGVDFLEARDLTTVNAERDSCRYVTMLVGGLAVGESASYRFVPADSKITSQLLK